MMVSSKKIVNNFVDKKKISKQFWYFVKIVYGKKQDKGHGNETDKR